VILKPPDLPVSFSLYERLTWWRTEGFGPKHVGNACTNDTPRDNCAKDNTVSRQAIAHHRTGCQLLRQLSYIGSHRIVTFLYPLQQAICNCTPSNCKTRMCMVVKYEMGWPPVVCTSQRSTHPELQVSAWHRRLNFRTGNWLTAVGRRMSNTWIRNNTRANATFLFLVTRLQYVLLSDIAIPFRVVLCNIIWYLKFSWRQLPARWLELGKEMTEVLGTLLPLLL
jgi:hypothetical protein